MLLAEKLFLLLYNVKKQRISGIGTFGGAFIGTGFAGAHLVDLSFKNKIEFLKNTKKIKVIDDSPTGDDLLDFVLNMIKKYKKEKGIFNILRLIVGKKGKGSGGMFYSKKPQIINNSLINRLAEKGIISIGKTKLILLKSQIRKEILEEVFSVALEGNQPDEKMEYFLALLYAMRSLCFRLIFPKEVRKEARLRIKSLIQTKKSLKNAVERIRQQPGFYYVPA